MVEMNSIVTLSQKELRDAVRNRWFLLYAVTFTLLSVAMAWMGLSGLGTFGLAGFGRTGASMINIVLLIVPLMGLTLGALGLALERERGSLLYLLAQPVTSTEVLLGKYAGMALALMSALAFGFGLSGLLITWFGGAADVGSYLTLVLYAVLLGLISLSLGFLISALVRKAATAIGIALFLWLLLVFLGDLGLMGTAIVLKLKADTLLALALLNPLQTYKIAAVLTIKDSLEILGPAGLYAARTFSDYLSVLLIGILLLWITVPLGITAVILRKRGAI